MKRIFFVSAIALAAMSARADVGALLGITYAFGSGGGVGISLLVTSTRHENRGTAAAGVSYYPFAPGQKFGIPVGVGYQWKNAGAVVGYDFLQQAPIATGGYVGTRNDRHSDTTTESVEPPPPEV